MNIAPRMQGPTLEDALLSPNESIRVFARLAASITHDSLTDFINEERARGTDVNALLNGLTNWMVQTHAAVAVQFLSRDSGSDAAHQFAAFISQKYTKHFDLVGSYLAGREALP